MPVRSEERPMRRRAKPAKSKVEAKPPVARKSPRNEGSRIRDLEKRLAEALEQQTATSEILRVISSSPTDIEPVFEAIAERAGRLCEGIFSAVYRFDGELLHFVAHHGIGPEGGHLSTTPGGACGCVDYVFRAPGTALR
jgi:hypothetical protein